MNNSTHIFGNRLKELRLKNGLSQSELGLAVGLSRGAISYYEAGDRTPDISVLFELAKYFNVTSDFLIGLSDNSTTDIEIQEISERIGLSDKAIQNMEKLKNNPFSSKESLIKGIDYIFAKEMEIDVFPGDAFHEIDYSKNYQGSVHGGKIDEIATFIFYGNGIAFLKQLNQILFSTYIDFNPYVRIGYNGHNEHIVISKENARDTSGTFSLLDTDGSSHSFDLEIVRKALLLKMNDVLSDMRNHLEHKYPEDIKITFDKELDEFYKADKERRLTDLCESDL